MFLLYRWFFIFILQFVSHAGKQLMLVATTKHPRKREGKQKKMKANSINNSKSTYSIETTFREKVQMFARNPFTNIIEKKNVVKIYIEKGEDKKDLTNKKKKGSYQYG